MDDDMDEYKLPPSHDNAMVLKSQAFVALNVFIDGKVEHLKWLHDVVRRRMEELLKPSKYGRGPTISTRSAQENKNSGEIPLPFDSMELVQLSDLIKEIAETESLISELVRYKIRLLNDYDFTKGRPTEQIAVFGPVPDAKD